MNRTVATAIKKIVVVTDGIEITVFLGNREAKLLDEHILSLTEAEKKVHLSRISLFLGGLEDFVRGMRKGSYISVEREDGV